MTSTLTASPATPAVMRTGDPFGENLLTFPTNISSARSASVESVSRSRRSLATPMTRGCPVALIRRKSGYALVPAPPPS